MYFSLFPTLTTSRKPTGTVELPTRIWSTSVEPKEWVRVCRKTFQMELMLVKTFTTPTTRTRMRLRARSKMRRDSNFSLLVQISISAMQVLFSKLVFISCANVSTLFVVSQVLALAVHLPNLIPITVSTFTLSTKVIARR